MAHSANADLSLWPTAPIDEPTSRWLWWRNPLNLHAGVSPERDGRLRENSTGLPKECRRNSSLRT